jgi:O-antigen ligase
MFLGVQLVATILLQAKVDNRAIGTLGEANSLAAYVIFLLPWVMFRRAGEKEKKNETEEKDKKTKWLRTVGILIGIIIILFTGSRSGVIALGIMVVFSLLKHFSLKAAIIVSFILFVASLALPFFEQGQLFENRATVWETAVVAGSTKPLLGWGPGNTEIALRETAQRIGNALQYEYVDHTHNILLEYWVIGGSIGLGAFGYVLYSAFAHFIKLRKPREFVTLLGLFIMLSFNPLSIAVLLQFWWLIGMGISQETDGDRSGDDR